MESTTRIQILDEAICCSLHANKLEKGMNVPPSYRFNFRVTFVGHLVYERKKHSKLKGILLCLKKLTLCHILVVEEGLGNIYF